MKKSKLLYLFVVLMLVLDILIFYFIQTIFK